MAAKSSELKCEPEVNGVPALKKILTNYIL